VPNSNRRLDNNLNIFEGFHRNPYFLGINLIIAGGQFLIITLGGSALSVTYLTAQQWAISLVLGVMSIPMGAFIRLIPDRIFQAKADHKTRIRASPAPGTRFVWNQEIENVRSELAHHRWDPRGSRLKRVGSQVVAIIKMRLSGQPADETTGDEARPLLHSDRGLLQPRPYSVFAPATVMAGIVAGSVAGWPASGVDG